MPRWIAYIKSLNPEIRHIFRKTNAMADMLSRGRFEGEDGMVSESEDVGLDFFESAQLSVDDRSPLVLQAFNENDHDRE